MKQRDELRVTAVQTDHDEDWLKFRQIRNKVSNSVKKDRKLYFDNLYSKADNNCDTRYLYRISKEK